MKNILVIILLSLIGINSFSQCLDENANSSNIIGFDGRKGQSFVADCSGLLESFAFQWSDTTIFSVLVRNGLGLSGTQIGSTIENQTSSPSGPGVFQNVDMSSADIYLVQGQNYTVEVNPANGGFFSPGALDTNGDTKFGGDLYLYPEGLINDSDLLYQLTVSHIITPSNNIIFVDENAIGNNSGSSWANALTNLQDALTCTCDYDKIYVNKGTYKPTTTTARNIYFNLVDGKELYGGFDVANGVTAFEDRDYVANETILSGDIGVTNDNTDNSYHVVYANLLTASAIFDGFVITKGNAVGGIGDENLGGGMVNYSSSTTINNIIYRENTASQWGGGLWNYNSVSIINNITIVSNVSSQGGGLLNWRGSPTIVNSVISGNLANDGGGVFNLESSPNLINVTLSGNNANSTGGAIYYENGGIFDGNATSTLKNCIIWNNEANNVTNSTTASIQFDSFGGGPFGSSELIISNSIIANSGGSTNWNVNDVTDDGNNLDVNPLFISDANPTTAPNAIGNLRLQPSSPAINAGNNADVPSGVDIDLDGNQRIQGSAVDMGAYEHLDCTGVISLSFETTNVTCNGLSNGAIDLTINGGIAPITIDWNTNSTTEDLSDLAAGTYTVTVTEGNGCIATQEITITEPTALIANALSQTNITCNGSSNGSATVSVSGGTGDYSYSWSNNSSTTATASDLSAGTYTVTVTDANGCETTQEFTITEPTALTANASSQTNINCNGSSNGAATVSVSGGTGNYSYSWSSNSSTTATASDLSAGTYTVTVTDANGCETTQEFTITEPTALTATASSQTNIACNGSATGSATVSVSGGTGDYSYSWTNSSDTIATASNLSAGTYTVTVTDANGCETTQEFTITEPTALTATASSQTNITCNGSSNGSATVSVSGGTGDYTYSWSSNSSTTATASDLSTGTYTVTVIDANGCETTQEFTITEPVALVATASSQTNITCNGSSNGSATVSVSGGTRDYTYSWTSNSSTTATASDLSAGTYTVTVIDANGCETTQEFIITEPAILSSEVTLDNGVLTATESGLLYQWYECPNTLLTDETNQTFTPTMIGDYKVVISNVDDCSVTSECINVTTLGLESTPEAVVSLMLYPNPTSSELHIQGLKVSTSYEIIDMLGKRIQKGRMDANTTLYVDNLNNGMYFIMLENQQTFKFIKK